MGIRRETRKVRSGREFWVFWAVGALLQMPFSRALQVVPEETLHRFSQICLISKITWGYLLKNVDALAAPQEGTRGESRKSVNGGCLYWGRKQWITAESKDLGGWVKDEIAKRPWGPVSKIILMVVRLVFHMRRKKLGLGLGWESDMFKKRKTKPYLGVCFVEFYYWRWRQRTNIQSLELNRTLTEF